MIRIITHRGLDAEGHHSYTESSREAFAYFLDKGFGIEFDIQITKDGVPVISHDESLSRLTGNTELKISEINATEFVGTTLPNGHPILLSELVALMREYANQTNSVHALHLKYQNQTPAELDILIPYLTQLSDLPIMAFDVTPNVAKQLKKEVSALSLAASVAHPHDIERYNTVVGGTLLSLKELFDYSDIYDWAWLDEWDRVDADGGVKSLYTEEIFSLLKEKKFKIVVVSPELHATSPHLLGGESHTDGITLGALQLRWEEIFMKKPDAICTDYPHSVSKLQS